MTDYPFFVVLYRFKIQILFRVSIVLLLICDTHIHITFKDSLMHLANSSIRVQSWSVMVFQCNVNLQITFAFFEKKKIKWFLVSVHFQAEKIVEQT